MSYFIGSINGILIKVSFTQTVEIYRNSKHPSIHSLSSYLILALNEAQRCKHQHVEYEWELRQPDTFLAVGEDHQAHAGEAEEAGDQLGAEEQEQQVDDA